MIALDTNVLIRVLTADDPKQTELAERLLREAAEAGESCFVSDPVLCETEWVLDSYYGVPRSGIAAALESLLARRNLFSFEDADVFRKALDAYRQGKAEFSDFLIGAKAEARGARTTFTFDRDLASQQGFSILK
ncbi:MAG: PIN domain-containing protein [Thermoanaerobaculia bacterium]